MSFPFPVSLFFVAAGAFALFSLGYAIVAASIIYHLRMFSIPGRIAPRTAMLSFIAASTALWLVALFFLFHFPR